MSCCSQDELWLARVVSLRLYSYSTLFQEGGHVGHIRACFRPNPVKVYALKAIEPGGFYGRVNERLSVNGAIGHE
jgi:hypothetical protein